MSSYESSNDLDLQDLIQSEQISFLKENLVHSYGSQKIRLELTPT